MTDETMPGAIICKACNKSFSWSAEDLAFYNKLGYEPLELCVDCGHQQRLAHRVVLCSICDKNFRVISQELKWYKSQKIPLPHECPRCRIRTRRAFRNPEEIWQRKCAGCQMEIFTTYSPERPEKVYCEQCYLKTVY